MDRGVWWATDHRVTKHRTWLKWLSMHTQYKGRDLQENKLLQSSVVGGMTGIHLGGIPGGTPTCPRKAPESFSRRRCYGNWHPIWNPQDRGEWARWRGGKGHSRQRAQCLQSSSSKDAHSPMVERKSIHVMRNHQMTGKVMGNKVRGEQIIKVIRSLELILRAVRSLRRAFSIKAQRTKGRKALPKEAYIQQRSKGFAEETVAPAPWFLVHPTPKGTRVLQKAGCCLSYRPFLIGTVQAQGEIPHGHVRVFTCY